mmetsp:Transcript_66780/g.204397  ORF Transcript_66780/g.204397 Transcript_66780/m.204397 type:complete len:346 (+) Transcript_66780:853-1890(+)
MRQNECQKRPGRDLVPLGGWRRHFHAGDAVRHEPEEYHAGAVVRRVRPQHAGVDRWCAGHRRARSGQGVRGRQAPVGRPRRPGGRHLDREHEHCVGRQQDVVPRQWRAHQASAKHDSDVRGQRLGRGVAGDGQPLRHGVPGARASGLVAAHRDLEGEVLGALPRPRGEPRKVVQERLRGRAALRPRGVQRGAGHTVHGQQPRGHLLAHARDLHLHGARHRSGGGGLEARQDAGAGGQVVAGVLRHGRSVVRGGEPARELAQEVPELHPAEAAELLRPGRRRHGFVPDDGQRRDVRDRADQHDRAGLPVRLGDAVFQHPRADHRDHGAALLDLELDAGVLQRADLR